jgi:hypothetical protein
MGIERASLAEGRGRSAESRPHQQADPRGFRVIVDCAIDLL